MSGTVEESSAFLRGHLCKRYMSSVRGVVKGGVGVVFPMLEHGVVTCLRRIEARKSVV